MRVTREAEPCLCDVSSMMQMDDRPQLSPGQAGVDTAEGPCAAA